MKKPLVGAVLSCLCGAAFAVNGAHEGLPDGAVFDLKLAGPVTPGDASTYGNVCNGMRWSAADTGKVTAMTSYNGGESEFGVPAPIAVSNQTFALPAYHWTNQTDAVLSFPCPESVSGDVTKYFSTGLTMPAVEGLGSNVTYHIRFRWDGNLRESYEQILFDHAKGSTSGFGLHLYHPAEGLTKDLNATYFRAYVGGGNHNFYSQIFKGRWYDFVCVMRYRDDIAGSDPLTQVTCYLCYADKDDGSTTHTSVATGVNSTTVTEGNYRGKFPHTATDAKGKPVAGLLIGHSNESYHQPHGWQASNGTVGLGFRGAISKLRIFNRALALNEVWSLVKATDGAQVSAGSVNGSADEFGAGGATDIAEVYEPMTMPISRMRGALDAAHPSLTFRYPIHPEEVGGFRVLRVVPILEGTGASVPVAVSVNGVKAGTFDLAQEPKREIGIRGSLMTRDADGNVTVTLTRVGDLAGTLKIDAFKISGAWAFGVADGTYAYDWWHRNYDKLVGNQSQWLVNEFATLGGPWNIPFASGWMNGMKNEGTGSTLYYPMQNISFDVPPSVAARSARYELCVHGASYNHTTVDLYLNGVRKVRNAMPAKKGEMIGMDIAPGELAAGLNTITVSNSTYNLGAGFSQYASLSVDYHRFRVTEPSIPVSFTNGADVVVKLTGDVDLGTWTVDVTGVPTSGRVFRRGSFTFRAVTSGGTLTGTPTFTGIPEKWTVEEVVPGVWKVGGHDVPGLLIAVGGGIAANPPRPSGDWTAANCVVAVNSGTGFNDRARNDLKNTVVPDLADALERILGARPQVCEEGTEPQDANVVYLGDTAAARAAGMDPAELRRGDWRVRVAGGKVYLQATSAMGTMSAAADFLESCCDYWVLDPDGVDVFTYRPGLKVAACDRLRRPSIYVRTIYQGMNDGYKYPTLKGKWARFARFRRVRTDAPYGEAEYEGAYRVSLMPGTGHSFFSYCDPETYFATHPEYFSYDTSAGARIDNGQLCLSNPDVRAICLERMLGFIAKDRTANPGDPPLVYDISQIDNGAAHRSYNCMCECPACQAVMARHATDASTRYNLHESGGDAGLVIDFVNDLAREVAKTYPDVRLRTFAYVSTSTPPTGIRPEPNVLVRWCDVYSVSDQERPLVEGPFNPVQAQEFLGWRALVTDGMPIWDYALPNRTIPEVLADAVAGDARFFADNGVCEVNMESEFNHQPFYALNYFLMSKLYEDPSQDADKLVWTYCRAYGPAAERMFAAIQFLRTIVRENPAPTTVAWHNRESSPAGLPWNTVGNMTAFFSAVEKAYGIVADTGIRQRITPVLMATARDLIGLTKGVPGAEDVRAKAKADYEKYGKEYAAHGLLEEIAREAFAAAIDTYLDNVEE